MRIQLGLQLAKAFHQGVDIGIGLAELLGNFVVFGHVFERGL